VASVELPIDRHEWNDWKCCHDSMVHAGHWNASDSAGDEMAEDSELAEEVEDDAREVQKFLEHDDRNVLAKQIDIDCSIQYADVGDVADAADDAASAAAVASAAVDAVVAVDDTYLLSVE